MGDYSNHEQQQMDQAFDDAEDRRIGNRKRLAEWTAPMSEVAERFPSLRGKPGVRPWDSLKLAAWARSGVSHGELCAAKFVIGVWAGDGKPLGYGFKRGFDLIEAMKVWDSAHVAAALAWMKEPYWP